MMTICQPLTAFSAVDLYKILQLRSEVFVVEQNCIYQDLDGKDLIDGVHHLCMSQDDELVAYARLLPKGVSYDNVSIGRVVIASAMRGSGLGETLVANCLKHAQALWPSKPITIGAQSYLSVLYQKFGFVEVSEHYEEDGILHVDMTAISPQYEDFL